VFIKQYLYDNDIKQDYISRACSMYGGENICVKDYGVETWRKKPHGRPRHRW